MKIVADENMPGAVEYFSRFGDVQLRPGRQITQADLVDADVLLVRSVTRVDESLLQNTPVRFVGSATIGADHLDVEFLIKQQIGYSCAPGCNAQAVVDYVCAALLYLEAVDGVNWEGKTAGIVGMGNVGRRLRQTLERLGMRTLVCDPPLQAQGIAGLVDLDTALQADIVSLHTPLIRQGPHTTFHLLNCDRLLRLKKNALLVNTSRGAVIDGKALLEVLRSRDDLTVVLDVWENEPAIDVELAQRVRLATPHIAGYSFDGKLRGTDQVYQAFCSWLGVPPVMQMSQLIPEQLACRIDLTGSSEPIHQWIRRVYDIAQDDAKLRKTLNRPELERVRGFDLLRKEYPLRRELAQVQLTGVTGWGKRTGRQETQRLEALGFVKD
jgi:erythronate-4-phosphate dehydrogenase